MSHTGSQLHTHLTALRQHAEQMREHAEQDALSAHEALEAERHAPTAPEPSQGSNGG